jgi:hypothetical protein
LSQIVVDLFRGARWSRQTEQSGTHKRPDLLNQ